MTIPEGTSGELRMQITAQDSGDCKVASAEVTEKLGPGFHFIREQDVSLTQLAVPTCQLVLELPEGASSAMSDLGELDCREGMTRCEAELPKGSVIRFLPTTTKSWGWQNPKKAARPTQTVRLSAAQPEHTT